MPIRRLLTIVLAVTVVLPVGMFIRDQWNEDRACEREFGRDSTNYEICTEYGGGPEKMCLDLERQPFSCSTEYIGGRRKLVAARNAGLYQLRLECAALNQISGGTRCSPEQWDGYCSQRHAGSRRCREVGPDGPEGVPKTEYRAKVSAPVGPLSGPRPACGTLTTYELPGVTPGAVGVDEDGSVWFTEYKTGALSHMTVEGKVSRRFISARLGALVRAPGGDLWGTDKGGNSIWQLTRGGELRRHPIPTATGRQGPGGSGPSDITVGSDGSVWFVETEADQVGRITPDGTIAEVPLFSSADGFIRPSTITASPDGSVWVSAPLARRVARVDGRTLTVTQFPVATGGGTVDAQSVAADVDGGVWFERSAGSAMDNRPPMPALGRMDRAGKITYHPLPGGGPRWPGSLTAGPDGAIWFLDGPAKTIGRMALDGIVTEFPLAYPDVSGPTTEPLAAGSNALWFALPQTNRLGLITCQGRG